MMRKAVLRLLAREKSKARKVRNLRPLQNHIFVILSVAKNLLCRRDSSACGLRMTAFRGFRNGLKFAFCTIILVFDIWTLNFSTCLGFAFNNPEIGGFNTANVYYEQGNFDEAIKQYNGILESGWESGNLYYNLGNCYFKKGEIGKAILNYEKARRILPRDKDLESNYEYASSLIKGGDVASRKSPSIRVLNGLFEKITADGLTILLSILYMLILISILAGFFFRPFKKHALILAAFTGVFFTISFMGMIGKIALLNNEAVVIVEQADVKFEPMNKATTYFTLYEGMKVEIISSKGNWRKVKRQDNKSGWIENSAIAIF